MNAHLTQPRRYSVKKAILKQPFLYIALLNFTLAISFSFVYKSTLLSYFGSFVWFLSFLVNLSNANKATKKK